ncbi:hypothetical protein Bca101_040145 [Brassica carinata]
MAPPALTDAEILTHLQDMLQIQQQLTTVVQALAQPQEKADNNEEDNPCMARTLTSLNFFRNFLANNQPRNF